jgi:acyl carrier protein
MDRGEILDGVRKLAIETNPDLKAADITEIATFGTMGLDSVRMVELSVRVEEMFGSQVALDDWIDQEAAGGDGNFTVGSLVTFIDSSLAK